MADPNWIKKTAALSAVLALPAALLLASLWRAHIRDAEYTKGSLSFWTGVLVLVTYGCWFVNVTVEGSVAVMVGWPLVGILLSILGTTLAFWGRKGARLKLAAANLLLLVLSLASIIAPN